MSLGGPLDHQLFLPQQYIPGMNHKLPRVLESGGPLDHQQSLPEQYPPGMNRKRTVPRALVES